MPTLAFSSVGSTLSISAGVPATFNAAGFAALTYTLVKDLTDIGVIGGDTSIINHNPVAENTTYKLKGSRDPGSLSLKGAYAPTDPGQILLKAADVSPNTYCIKMVLQNGTIFYSQALITGFKVTVGGQSQITGMEANAALSGDLVVV
jgi:hypothetical protein